MEKVLRRIHLLFCGKNYNAVKSVKRTISGHGKNAGNRKDESLVWKWVCFFKQPKSKERMLRSEEHTSELQSRFDLVCRLLLEKKNITKTLNVQKLIYRE